VRNFLAFLAALVIVVAGLGWYLGWYKIDSLPLIGGHKRVTVDIDTNKVKDDVKKGGEVVIEKGKQAVEKIADKAADEAAKKTKKAVKDGAESFDPFKLPGTEEEPSEPFSPSLMPLPPP
jgi:hypothetical protein